MSTFLEAMVNGWWQGIILTLLVWLVLRDLPRFSAATRLAIWHVTLLIVLLLPALQRIPLPSWPRERPVPAAPSPAPVAEEAPALMPHARPAPLVELPQADGPPVVVVICLGLAAMQLLRLAIGYLVVRRLK